MPLSILKRALLASLDGLTRRHAVLLPDEAAGEEHLLDAQAPYRVEGRRLVVTLREPQPGRLRVTLLGYEGHFPRRALWESPPLRHERPGALILDLDDGVVRLDERTLGRAPLPSGRRFCLRLVLDGDDGRTRTRTTAHYLPGDGRPVDESYYRGDTYVDHEAQSEADRVLALLRRHGARGPVLDVGCATGGLLAALDAAGPALAGGTGVDVSAWAVAEAAKRLGPGRAFACDPGRAPLPDEVRARGPFRSLVLWAVLEHFEEPFAALARLAEAAAPGAMLFLNTSNCDGLCRALFGRDWEGHFDWTHAGVEKVGVRSLREELPRLGFRIVELATEQVWDASTDASHATVREWWQADARFRRLLVERDLGDFITCVAVREERPD